MALAVARELPDSVNMKANAEEMTGFFVRRYPNGLYEGDMFGGKMEGKGRFAFRGGDVYEGDWLDNKMHGKGKYTYGNGETFEGQYVAGKKHGLGTFSPNGGVPFIAQYTNGTAIQAGTSMVFNSEGQGTLLDANTWASMRKHRPRAGSSHAEPQGYVGVGIVFRQLDHGGMAVKEVVEGESAEASKKILRGDILIAVDKQDVSQADVHDVAPLVRGPKGSPVLLQFVRGGTKPFEVILTRGVVEEEEDEPLPEEPEKDPVWEAHVKALIRRVEAGLTPGEDDFRIMDQGQHPTPRLMNTQADSDEEKEEEEEDEDIGWIGDLAHHVPIVRKPVPGERFILDFHDLNFLQLWHDPDRKILFTKTLTQEMGELLTVPAKYITLDEVTQDWAKVDPDVHVLGHEVRIPRYGAAPMHKIARVWCRLAFDQILDQPVNSEVVGDHQKHIVEGLQLLVEKQADLLIGFHYLQRLFRVELLGIERAPKKKGARGDKAHLTQRYEFRAMTEVGKAPRVNPTKRDLTDRRALIEEQLASQEESRAIWSQKFLAVYGNPHMMVLKPVYHLEMMAKIEQPIEETEIKHTTVFMVQKRLNLLEDGERRLTIDKHQRAFVNSKPLKDGEWQVQKTHAFLKISKILPHVTHATHLVIEFKGGQRPYILDFSTHRDRTLFLAVLDHVGVERSAWVETQVTGALIPAVDGKNQPIVDSAMRRTVMCRKMTGRLPVEYDAYGHPRPNLNSEFIGYELHPGRIDGPDGDPDDPLSVMIPPNARTPALSRQQVTYVQARPGIGESYYGASIHAGTDVDEASIMHHTDDGASSSAVSRSAKGVLINRSLHTQSQHSRMESHVKQESHMCASDASLPEASSIGANHLPARQRGGETAFKAEDHVMAYRIIERVDEDRQLTKEEVELAVGTKYAERAVQSKVRHVLALDDAKEKKRKSVYQKLVLDRGLQSNPGLLHAVDREMVGLEECKRFRDMLSEKQGHAKQHLAHPLAFPLPLKYQEIRKNGAGGDSQSVSSYTESQASSSRAGSRKSGSRAGGSVAGELPVEVAEVGPARMSAHKYTVTAAELNGDRGFVLQPQDGDVPELQMECEKTWGGKVFHIRHRNEGEVATADAREAGEALLSFPEGTATVRKFSEAEHSVIFRVTQSSGNHLRVAAEKSGAWIRITSETHKKFSNAVLVQADREAGSSGWVVTFMVPRYAMAEYLAALVATEELMRPQVGLLNLLPIKIF